VSLTTLAGNPKRCLRFARSPSGVLRRSVKRFSALVLFVVAMPLALWSQPDPVITRVDQIRRLSPDEAGQGRPVRIRGVVTMDAPAPAS